MDPAKITELANLLRNNGDKILNSEFNFTLSGALLRALNDSFTLIADAAEIGPTQNFQVLKPNNSKSSVFRDLQLVHDFVQKTAFLCIVQYVSDERFEGNIDIAKFRCLKRLEVQKTNIKRIVGIQPLRAQIQQLICVKSLQAVDDIITHCGGDNANGFVWNELKIADFSYNELYAVDTALEFAQYLQHLNLRHNKLVSVDAIKWLPNLKTLDLSYNRLDCIPQFHMEACRRLQVLNMSNNFVESLQGISCLDALTDLDLADNCLLNHQYLLPLSAILTLKYLNLYGNPLHCHPKHRLATAQFLHKNTATVKFILDFEPLSKHEKACTGAHQRQHASSGFMSRFRRYQSSSSFSSNISIASRSSTQGTPASSVGSQRSFQLVDNAQDSLSETRGSRRRAAKARTVDIGDADEGAHETVQMTVDEKVPVAQTTQPQTEATIAKPLEESVDHLTAKQQVEQLRTKYGADWLQSQNAEMMHSVLGIGATQNSSDEEQRLKSRQLFQDYIGDFSTATTASASPQAVVTGNDTATSIGYNETLRTSTPTDTSYLNNDISQIQSILSPIKPLANANESASMYMSMDNTNQTLYKSAADDTGLTVALAENGVQGEATEQQVELDEECIDLAPHLKDVYSTSVDVESDVSEPEDDNDTYIVYTTQSKDPMLLTLSDNYLREKDTTTERTKTKWSLQILESCERIKATTLRLHFDTVKLDKQERVYDIKDGLCQQLETKLRAILAQRDLADMNQTLYRCVNCTCQFSRENKNNYRLKDVSCPDCRSTFVAEIHDIPKSLEKVSLTKLSPAVMALPLEEACMVATQENTDDTNSIGSANSLNESSSCSKISSCDSNRSVVGSSTTDRDADFNGESDVDILSNPSQSSIEVLDQMQHSSRKTSEERRLLHVPNLDTIDDHSFEQHYMQLSTAANSIEEDTGVAATNASQLVNAAQQQTADKPKQSHLNLTESSSSGSVTDSVCTAYEQGAATDKTLLPEQQSTPAQKIVIENMLHAEAASYTNNNNNNNQQKSKKDEGGISSMLGALFQSTNLLMSSSKKLIVAEGSANVQPGIAATSSTSKSKNSLCSPYKFNYSDFNDIDHRLKLYFYQTKFEEVGEHFKWLVRARIYNENTQSLFPGIVVMSTCKCFVMEAFAPEHDDVTKWLRPVVSVTADRVQQLQLLPWKLGLSFVVRDWGGFLLVLQDILRTDSLLLHFANNALPDQCELNYQVSEQIVKRLNNAVVDEKLKMISLLNGCEIKCENAKRSFGLCGLLTTDTRLYLSSGNLSWLCAQQLQQQQQTTAAINDSDLEICITQFMSNLIEVERPAPNVFTINFLDETQDKYELWKCVFETQENAESCFNAIGQSWEKLFGVPLFTNVES